MAVCLGGMMVALDGTAVTIAAPRIARSVDASLGDLELIANVYLVVLGLGILPAGRLADRVGRRATFIAGTLGFGLCSLGISLSHGVGELVVLRAGQGLSGALLQPSALALLSMAFPRERLGGVLGIWGAVNALAIGLGPVIAGFVVEGFGWPAVFLINVPIALLAAALIVVAASESRAVASPRPLRAVLAARSVRCGAVLVAVSSFAVFGLLFLLTFYLQNVRGLTPSTAGAWLLTPTLAVVIGAPVGGLVAERAGSRWPVVLGMLAVAIGLAGLTQVPVSGSFWQVALPALLVGFGIGSWVIAATQTIVADSPEDLVGTASAVVQTASQVGGVLGIAVFGAVMSLRLGADLGPRLRDVGVPGPVAAAVERSRDLVGEGRVPLPRGTPPRLADLVRSVCHLAFTGGMHTAFLLAGVLILLAAPLGLLLGGAESTGG
ncbi:MAG TPA: MFS transporter [Solirubrobacteraceae bacterium]|nr:MFS transporter [Solirubrobacteraceae bacterium]